MSAFDAREIATAPSRVPAASETRALSRDDLEGVGELFQQTFRGAAPGAPVPRSLTQTLAGVYLDHPWSAGASPALVLSAPGGRVDGFVGSLPLRLTFRGRPLTGAVAGALMVRAPKDDPMAAPRLLRRWLQGPQDLSLSDTANPAAFALWRRLGVTTLPIASLEFSLVLRPMGYAARLAARRLSARGADALKAPLAAAFARFGGAALRRPDGVRDEAADDEAFLDAFELLFARAPLALAPDRAARAWFLERAASRQGRGPLERRVVKDARGTTLGAYLAYVTRGGPFVLLDAMARPGAAQPLVASFLARAAEARCVEAMGRTRPHLFEALADAGCRFAKHGSVVVGARDSDLLAALKSGEAEVGGFIGGMWSRLDSDRFE